MNLIYWSGVATDVIQYGGQSLTVGYSTNPNDPIGTVTIRGTGTSTLLLPNSTVLAPLWSPIPGTSPPLEARQDGHFSSSHILIRQVAAFTNVTPVHANIILGSVPAGTRITMSGDEVRFRGFLQATGVVAASAVLANIATTAHRPPVNKSLGVRYTAGSSRFQVMANGDLTLGSSLALNDQVWLDSTTYDLLLL